MTVHDHLLFSRYRQCVGLDVMLAPSVTRGKPNRGDTGRGLTVDWEAP